MRSTFVPPLLTILLTFIIASCDMFEKDLKKSSNNDEETNMQAYSDQAQNSLFDVWEKGLKQNIANGRALSSDSVDVDSLTEVCGLKAHMDFSKVRPILTVNFTSFRCEYFNIVREGVVRLELLAGTSIVQKNSVAKFTFEDFRVTDIMTGKYVIFNGYKVITNLSGGVLTNMVADQPELIHKVRSEDFHIFYSGSSGDIIKNTARIVKFSKLDFANNYQMITYPDTTVNGIENVADWGTLRNGTPYYHIIKKPIFYESCSKLCRYTKGERIQKIEGGRETTTIFGVDKNGNKMQNCAAYGKLVYYFNSKGDSTATVVKYN